MILRNGTVIFECDKNNNGQEMDNYSQRNNELVWPSKEDYPNAQYRTSWKNTCNVTSYIMALSYSGFIFPVGKYKQPEDNLAYHILTSKTILQAYKERQPAMYENFIKCLKGKCTKEELKNVYFPNELHDYLCMGANEWLGTKAAKFSTSINFKKALWKFLVEDNLPMVISTSFGGYGHIVVVTGVIYNEEDYNEHKDDEELPEITPKAIIVDDPWGKYDPEKDAYTTTYNGNDIEIPWQRVISSVKPYKSETLKWAHMFNHSAATI